MTTPPFTFNVAVTSWARKNRSNHGRTPFTPDSRIGKYEMLSLRWDGDGQDPGDDFFYITKVSRAASRLACVNVLILSAFRVSKRPLM